MSQSENYLQVDIDILSKDEDQFRSLMSRLMPSFTTPPTPNQANLTFGWDLKLATRQVNGDKTRIRHLWNVDPANPWMVDVMGELGTLPDYATLDKLVLREEQNYMLCNERYFTESSDASEWAKADAIETLQVTSGPGDLRILEGSLLTRTGIDYIARDAKAQHGWTLLAEMTPVTGLLRQFVHYWATDANGTQDVEVFRAWLLQRVEYQKAVVSTSIISTAAFAYASVSTASGQ